MNYLFIILMTALLSPSKTTTADTLDSDLCKVSIAGSGSISEVSFLEDGKWEAIPWRKDRFGGPQWVRVPAWQGVVLKQVRPGEQLYEAEVAGIRYSLEYAVDGRRIAVVAGLKNEVQTTFKPQAAHLHLGIDTEMVGYPEWNNHYFPTLLRGEKTHMWGYFMSPKGKILTMAVQDPVASWNYHFQPKAHRIYTVGLSLLNELPLPARHPQDMAELAPGQEMKWTIHLEPVDSIDKVKPVVERNCGAPMLEFSHYTLEPGGKTDLTVLSQTDVEATITDPAGKEHVIPVKKSGEATYNGEFYPEGGVGTYVCKVRNAAGKVSEGMINVRHPWSWYLKQARKEAIRIPQKASTHCESWMGHFSNFLARRHFPEPGLDQQAEENFQTILPLMFDTEKGAQTIHTWRIQNTYYMISLLVDKYRADGNIRDLELASKLADWLMTKQKPDGSYDSGKGHYTSVAYGAKSMLELTAVEKELGSSDPEWQTRYERHFDSAKRAVVDLRQRLDNVGTEGQPTYEDGMISCTATQLAMMALLAENDEEKACFQKAAEYMFSGHRCLDQMIVPDSRLRGGTLRFWEAQYDVMIPHNMMNSPHGWTAWRIPGFYYMYQLTGDEQWLSRAMESLGACVQLIDGQSGKLRWAFVQDPHLRVPVLEPDPKDPTNPQGVRVSRVIGEQYVDMISHFFHLPVDQVAGGHWGPGGSCDNDVHEVFKALEEVALTAAYVVERDAGEVVGYNCAVEKKDGRILVALAEECVSRVHLNLKNLTEVVCAFAGGDKVQGTYEGMIWIGPGGSPEDLR